MGQRACHVEQKRGSWACLDAHHTPLLLQLTGWSLAGSVCGVARRCSNSLSTRASSSCPLSTAIFKGVWPSPSVASKLAPASSSTVATSAYRGWAGHAEPHRATNRGWRQTETGTGTCMEAED
jgi:hypothetical protein